VGQNDRMFFRVKRENGIGAFYSDPISAVFDADYDTSQWQGQVIETHAFGSSAASQFLLAWSDIDWGYQLRNPSRAIAAFPTTLNFWAQGTFTNLAGHNWIGAYRCHCTQFQVSEDVAKIWGRQKFGFGATFNREYWGLPPNTVNAVGQLSVQTLQAFYQGGIDLANRSVDFTALTQSFTSQPSVSVSFGSFQAYAQDEWRARPDLTITLALRAEHRSNFWCNNRCFARPTGAFESISHDPDQPYNQAILVNQKHALQNLEKVQWSPRLGFAWQPFGVSHNSVIRAGVGIFYDPLREGMAESFYLNAPIYNVYMVFNNNLTPGEANSLFRDTRDSNAAFVKGFAAGETLAQIQAKEPTFAPPALNSAETRMPQPQYQKWSLEWQQALGVNTSASVGYFGHHGIHEMVINPSANAFDFGSLPPAECTSPPVPPCSDPRFSQVTQYGMHAVSNYHGMVVSLRHQFTRWGNGLAQLNYTYGHALDEVSNGTFFSFTQGSTLYPQDPKNLRGAYGPAEYDARHSLNANYVWELPLKAALLGHGPDYLVKGWQVSGTIFVRTGFPYSVFDNAQSGNLQQNNYFGQIYAVSAGPIPKGSSCGEAAAFTVNLHPCLPTQFFVQSDGSTIPNPNALFIQATCETGFNTGTLPAASGPCDGPPVQFAQGRNQFRGPGYFNTDFGITKSTNISGWEKAKLGIGLQIFNLFNHPNFGFPDNWNADSTFGQIFYLERSPTSILGAGLGGDAAPRMIQLKAELRF
jgi:hypothetical protein